ncbi:3-oxoacyl-[acyl-carrier protein] reductase [Pseudohaliea rubra DSM 19751]|uniref:3-oxoacyl-[acyl-carrier protein] reductase n=1 Tax=Pseudohaliea rubra DSM 19751 TaxID=1265313 RepID=A0A095VRA9_9GAMM|nr:3-oxoacyl-[acyl-carrier protein] reductase [Pseudohaliea rubra DSM 19751]
MVTGGGSGLGADIVRALAAAGYRVGILDRDPGSARAVADGIADAVALAADVADADALAAALADFGAAPDLLVNNAGIVRFGALEEQSPEDYAATVNVNFLGSCLCARAVAPGMLERGSGHIINITSVNGVHPAPGIGLYGGTKAAMACMTQAMALEWGPRGVRANAIAPGFIDAGMSRPIYENPQARAVRSGGVPLRRLGEAADIAHAVLFLDSEQAAYINGHELVVDGGVINSVLAQLPRS